MIRNEFIIDAYTSVCNTKSYAASHKTSASDQEKRKRPATRNPRLTQPAFQNSSKTFNILPTQRMSERRWWPAKVAGCAHRLVATSKIHQHLAGGDLLPWRGDEGGTAAMASPGSRWPKTEGDGRVHFISKQVFHQAFKGSSTNKGIYNFTLDSGVWMKSSPAVWKKMFHFDLVCTNPYNGKNPPKKQQTKHQ